MPVINATLFIKTPCKIERIRLWRQFADYNSSHRSQEIIVPTLLKDAMLYPVILSGGSGTRLWPMSRASLPKQFLPLVSEHTMFQETLLRLKGVPDMAAPLVVCNNEHRFLAAEQLRDIG